MPNKHTSKIKSGTRWGLTLTACGALLIARAAAPFDADQQPIGWLAPIALKSSNLESGDTRAYRPWFENVFWQGDLVEYNINTLGEMTTGVTLSLLSPTTTGGNWSARIQFAAKDQATYWDSRRIITRSDGGTGIAFRTGTLSAAQLSTIDNTSTARAQAVVNYIRGNRSNEGAGYYFRARKNLLGDIVHSNPVYVGAPTANYTFGSYGDYQQSKLTRAGRVYVGANDGLLHAFDAATGDEVFAYAPSMLFSKLKELAKFPSFRHHYYVDGELTAGDVQLSGSWATVLVGGLGAGGKGLYALNVTDPAADTESAAAGKLMWERSAAGDNDLGYTYGRPSIAKLADGKWYAITGNGYSSTNGHAVLYLVEISTGAVTKVDTGYGAGSNPNGLSAPVVVDTDGDFIADYAYAGDIDGALWKFNLTGGPSGASATRLLQATDSAGRVQAITTMPEVARHPNGGYMIYFGTGRLLTGADAADTHTQSLYGVWDQGSGSISPSGLFTQTQNGHKHTYATGVDARTNSTEDVPVWTGTGANSGWRVDLTPGERLLTTPHLRAKRLQLVTTNPTITNNENWLVEVDYLSGGVPSRTVFDLNNDGVLDTQDHVDGNGDGDTTDLLDRPVAWRLSGGIMSQPVNARIRNGIDATYINGLTLPPECYKTSCDNVTASTLAVQLQQIYDQLVLENIKLWQLQNRYGASAGDVDIQQQQVDIVAAQLNAKRTEMTSAGITPDVTKTTGNAVVEAQAPSMIGDPMIQLQDKLQKAPVTNGPTFGVGRHSWVELFAP